MDHLPKTEGSSRRLRGKEAAAHYKQQIIPYFLPISLNQFASHVLPMIANDSTTPLAGRKIYDDSAVPSDIQTKFKWLELRSKILVHSTCIAIPWMVARYPASYFEQKNFKAGLNLFDKRVLAFALLLSLPMYPLLTKYMYEYEFIRLDKFMLYSRRDHKLSLYRKRFAEELPSYITDKYREDKQLTRFDRVQFKKQPREAKFVTPDVMTQHAENTENSHQPLEKDLSSS